MDSVAVTVPLRQPTKKMKKRKELDALAPPHAVSRRTSGKRSSQELLTDSSDERSEYWNVSTRNSRKCRGRKGRTCPGLLKACSAFLACASVLATASLIWLFIDVRQQLTALRTELDQVIAGNEGVPDALQKCHSISRDLQNNQTIIFSHLSDLKLQINNFTVQLAGIQHGLHQVQGWFQAAPELANVPKNLSALSTSVASFGSQIRDLGATVNILKETTSRVQNVQATLQQNISSIQHTVSQLTNITQKSQTADETKIKTDELNTEILQLANNLSRVYENLSATVNWTSKDQAKDHKILVSLQEAAQNISAKVISLQNEYSNISDRINTVSSMADQIKEIHATNTELTKQLKSIQDSYLTLKNSTSALITAMSDIQKREGTAKTKEADQLPNMSILNGTGDGT